jgi:hypothetical protein
MIKWPQPFWAVIIIFMGAILAVSALFCNADKDIRIAVIGLASSIITGALGYIGGHMSPQGSAIEINSSIPLPTQPQPPTK